MEMLLIRHGDPDYAHDSLTPRGEQEAEALAEHLLTAGITRLYCSPMGRARRTVQPTAAKLGMEAQILPWLRELNGCYDGQHWAWGIPPTEMLDLPAVPLDTTWQDCPPFGPHMKPVQDELARHFEALAADYGYEREGLRYRVVRENDEVLALFCHGGLIVTLLSYLFHWPLPLAYAHLAYLPTGVTRLRWVVGSGYAVPRARSINDLSHLWRLQSA